MLRARGDEVTVIAPDRFRTLAVPDLSGDPPGAGAAERDRAADRRARSDAFVHIATEGPLGMLARRHCLAREARLHHQLSHQVPRISFGARAGAALLGLRLHALVPQCRARLHGGDRLARATILRARGFTQPAVLVARRRPRRCSGRGPGADLGLPRPIFLSVGRVAVEKNLEAFLELDLPGSKVVVGDGPARDELSRAYPQAHFLGALPSEALAEAYAAADVFVFPSLTDTFGNVHAGGARLRLPVAAFPVTGPKDIITDPRVGVLDADLRKAALAALRLSREAAREFALALQLGGERRRFPRQHPRRARR